MAIFGLSSGKSQRKAAVKKSGKKTAGKGKQSSEAKAILKKMAAKKDAGDCAFC